MPGRGGSPRGRPARSTPPSSCTRCWGSAPPGRPCWPGSSAASARTRPACCGTCSPAPDFLAMLLATALSLACLAALLAWPVPAVLARAGWTRRDPLVALVCWQSLGLAGGLSIIGALLVHGLAPWGHSLPKAGWAVLTSRPAGDPVRGDHWVALTLAAVLASELVGVLLLSWFRTARTRRRHRELLELVVRPAEL